MVQGSYIFTSLTLILLIAATISIRLPGRPTSKLPMYCKNVRERLKDLQFEGMTATDYLLSAMLADCHFFFFLEIFPFVRKEIPWTVDFANMLEAKDSNFH